METKRFQIWKHVRLNAALINIFKLADDNEDVKDVAHSKNSTFLFWFTLFSRKRSDNATVGYTTTKQQTEKVSN